MAESAETLTKRRAAIADKAHRYHQLGKKGFSKRALARATVVPAACYGCESIGYSDTALRKLRTTALGTIATATQGGHMDAEWLIRDGATERLDPAFIAHAAPIVKLAEAW